LAGGSACPTLVGIDDPLEALEGVGISGESVAGCAGKSDFDIFYDEGVVGVVPEVGFDASRAAEAPFVVDERVDQEALIGIGGAVVFVVFGGELGEVFGFFVERDLVDGVDAVLESVETGGGLAGGGAGSGGILRIRAVSRGLFRSCHKSLDLRLAGEFGAGGRGLRLSASRMGKKGRKIKVEVL
jgi:hypothetical protein